MAHGCQAGLQQEARRDVYRGRILRGDEFYSGSKLGALGSDLGAIACFFEQPWIRVSVALPEVNQSWLLNEAAFMLRALGRLNESLEPMRVSGEMDVKVERWKGAAVSYSNLSELELTLGEVAGAVGDAEQSVTYADRSGEGVWGKVSARIRLADAQLAAGHLAAAEKSFTEIETELIGSGSGYRWLPGNWGCRHDEVRLAKAERFLAISSG